MVDIYRTLCSLTLILMGKKGCLFICKETVNIKFNIGVLSCAVPVIYFSGTHAECMC